MPNICAHKATDLRLLEAIAEFVSGHSDSAVSRFSEAVRSWGSEWIDAFALNCTAQVATLGAGLYERR